MSENTVPLSGQRNLGITMILISVIVFSLAGVFTKGVQAGAWEVIFWRGLFSAGFIILYTMWRKNFVPEFLHMGKSGLLAGVVGAIGTGCFLTAFKYTSIANVILVYSAAPIFAAILAWLWIGERVSRRTAIACVAAVIGVAIIMAGTAGGANLYGVLLSLSMTICLAILMAIYRRWPETPAAGPAALSSLLLLLPGFVFGDVLNVQSSDFTILVTFGLTFAIASVALGEGMKRIPAGEAALLSILETPLAPILGFLFFAEIPPLATFIGGGIVFAAVIWSQLETKVEKKET